MIEVITFNENGNRRDSVDGIDTAEDAVFVARTLLRDAADNRAPKAFASILVDGKVTRTYIRLRDLL